MTTPTELAAEIWGKSEGYSRNPGARRVRREARELFPEDAPGRGGDWDFTDEQSSRIRERLIGSPSTE